MAIYFLRFPGGKSRCLTFSYDDGSQHDRRLVEMFDEYKVKGTFNLNAGNAPGKPAPEHWQISKQEYSQVYKNHEIATHGYVHPILDSLNQTDMTRELLLDRMELERVTGRIIKGHAYPYGKPQGIDEMQTLSMKACEIDYARTVKSTYGFGLPTDWLNWNPTCHHNDQKLLELADTFLDYPPKSNPFRREPYLFYVWGHSFEFNSADNWEIMDNLLQKVSNRDEVWYATNGEIFSYVKAYNSLIWSAEKTRVYNPTFCEIFFATVDREYSVKPGEEIEL